jgi:RecJ-like exonuclease
MAKYACSVCHDAGSIVCPTCHGNGTIANTHFEGTGEYGGEDYIDENTGQIVVDGSYGDSGVTASGFITCPDCEGSGRVTCYACGGNIAMESGSDSSGYA